VLPTHRLFLPFTAGKASLGAGARQHAAVARERAAVPAHLLGSEHTLLLEENAEPRAVVPGRGTGELRGGEAHRPAPAAVPPRWPRQRTDEELTWEVTPRWCTKCF